MSQISIKSIRKDAGLTQQQLADRLGIPLRTVSSWETSPDAPSHRAAPRYLINLIDYAIRRGYTESDQYNSKGETHYV